MTPTQEQIDAEIKKLEELKPRVRQFTTFHDDNRAAIEIQLQALRDEIGEEELYDLLEEEDITQHEYDAATEAFNWLKGVGESETLSEEWQPLVIER